MIKYCFVNTIRKTERKMKYFEFNIENNKVNFMNAVFGIKNVYGTEKLFQKNALSNACYFGD